MRAVLAHIHQRKTNLFVAEKLGKQVSKIGNVGHPFLVLVFDTLGFHHAAVLVVRCILMRSGTRHLASITGPRL